MGTVVKWTCQQIRSLQWSSYIYKTIKTPFNFNFLFLPSFQTVWRRIKHGKRLGNKARKIDCSCVLSAYMLKPEAKFKGFEPRLNLRIKALILIILIILIIHIIVSCDPNVSLISNVKDWSHHSHVRLWHPSCVYFTAQRQYTSVLKMRTPLKKLSLHFNSLLISVSTTFYFHSNVLNKSEGGCSYPKNMLRYYV